MSITIELPAGPRNWHSSSTEELPTEVVRQSLHISIYVSGPLPDDPNPRRGVFAMGYRIGEDENRQLSADETTYILRVLEHAARTWRANHEEPANTA